MSELETGVRVFSFYPSPEQAPYEIGNIMALHLLLEGRRTTSAEALRDLSDRDGLLEMVSTNGLEQVARMSLAVPDAGFEEELRNLAARRSQLRESEDT